MKNKKIIFFLFLIVFYLFICQFNFKVKAVTGSGTPDDPYLISDCDGLNLIRNNLTAHYKLINDINLSECGVETWNNGEGFRPIGYFDENELIWYEFRGVFDGNNHTISNLYINNDTGWYQGLFGVIGEGAVIKNLKIENAEIAGSQVVGILVGYAGEEGSQIINCTVTGTVSGSEDVGGLAGGNVGTIINCSSKINIVSNFLNGGGLVGTNDGYIKNCHSSGTVISYEAGGGLVGFNAGIIKYCYSNCSVSGEQDLGGLVGYNSHEIIECYATGDVECIGKGGGLVGTNAGYTINCYSHGSVSGENRVGGLVGWNYNNITKCYSTGTVTYANSGGGLVGYSDVGSIVVYSYWDVDTSEQSESAGGEGRTTMEMSYPYENYDPPCSGLYEEWDLDYEDSESIWIHDNTNINYGYPYLRMKEFEAPQIFNKTYYVNPSFNPGTPGWHVTHWSTIKEAVGNCTDTLYNYTILVDGDGNTYNENIEVTSTQLYNTLRIIGNYTTEKPKVYGQNTTKSTFELKNNKILLSGFIIYNYVGKPYNYHGVSIGSLTQSQNNITITNCNISNAEYGILLRGEYFNINNNKINSTTTGIYVLSVKKSTIHNNKIHNCQKGIVTYMSTNNTISNNNIFTITLLGIDLQTSSNYNTIFYNNVSNCSSSCIRIYYSEKNTIYNNNFIGSYPTISGTVSNYWNKSYPICGNYYSLLTGTDSYRGPNQNIPGSDGIYDTPYTIDSSNIDYYPFANTFTGEYPTLENYPPVLSNESPSNGSTGVSVNIPSVSINVSEPEGDPFNITIHGKYLNNISLNNQVNGTFTAYFKETLPYDTDIWWYVNVSSNNTWVNASYYFHTTPSNRQPSYSNPSPSNNSKYILINSNLSITVTDPDGDMMNVSFYWGNGSLIRMYTDVANGSRVSLYIFDYYVMSHYTVYSWYVNISDGSLYSVTPVYVFTTCKAYDLNGDGVIGYLDVSMLVSNYGKTVSPPGSQPWDINDDGVVNYLDVSSLVSHYGERY